VLPQNSGARQHHRRIRRDDSVVMRRKISNIKLSETNSIGAAAGIIKWRQRKRNQSAGGGKAAQANGAANHHIRHGIA